MALFLLCLSAAGASAQAQTPGPAIAQDCLRLAATKIDWSEREVADKHRKIWLDTCRQAYAQNGDDPHIKVALA
jgi:hypothetical protein